MSPLKDILWKADKGREHTTVRITKTKQESVVCEPLRIIQVEPVRTTAQENRQWERTIRSSRLFPRFRAPLFSYCCSWEWWEQIAWSDYLRMDGLTSHVLWFSSAKMASPSPFCGVHDFTSLWYLGGTKWVCILYSLLGYGIWCFIRFACFSSIIAVYDRCKTDPSTMRVYHRLIVIDMIWDKGRFCM